MKIFTKLNKYFRILSLIQLPTPPKQWKCAAPPPPARCTSPPYSPPSRPPILGWLLCFKSSIGIRQRPWCILRCIFCWSICCAKWWDAVPPRAPLPTRLCSNIPSTTSANYWVDCWLSSSIGSHLRPRPHLPLYFLMRLVLVPKTGNQQRPRLTQWCAPCPNL